MVWQWYVAASPTSSVLLFSSCSALATLMRLQHTENSSLRTFALNCLCLDIPHPRHLPVFLLSFRFLFKNVVISTWPSLTTLSKIELHHSYLASFFFHGTFYCLIWCFIFFVYSVSPPLEPKLCEGRRLVFHILLLHRIPQCSPAGRRG